MKFYAGIGSRETPTDVCTEMRAIAERLRVVGYVLRSGGADGADTAFERGASGTARIYLPWRGFNGRPGTVVGEVPELARIAARYHPVWDRLTRGAKALHTRNVAQVLGLAPEASRSAFVVCWTPRGSGSGGTGQALRIATAHQVPIYDLADAQRRCDFYAFLGLAEAGLPEHDLL